MFNQGGTSAYGKGITSNLVSDEQRQRFNYGGRVGYQNRGYVNVGHPWEYPVFPTRFSSQRYIPDLPQGYTPILSPGKRGDPYTKIQDYGFTRDEDPQGEKTDYIPISGTDKRLEKLKMAPKYKNLDFTEQLEAEEAAALEAAETGVDPTPDSGRVFEDTAGDWRKNIAIPGVVEKEEEEFISKGPMGDEMWDQTTVRDDTDELDTPDRWAFLDENIAKKKKLARGHALMEGAAAAADWATGATPEKRGAAISKGLRGVGTIGAKYKGEAEDIKTKAKILGTIEDIKGERKEKQFEKQQEGYYDKMIGIRQEELELKKEAAKIAATDAPPEEQYQAMLVKGLLDVPQKKARLLGSILKKKIYYAGDKKTEDQYLNPENNGLLFVDVNGTIFRNVNGEKKDVKIYEDTEFFGK